MASPRGSAGIGLASLGFGATGTNSHHGAEVGGPDRARRGWLRTSKYGSGAEGVVGGIDVFVRI